MTLDVWSSKILVIMKIMIKKAKTLKIILLRHHKVTTMFDIFFNKRVLKYLPNLSTILNLTKEMLCIRIFWHMI